MLEDTSNRVYDLSEIQADLAVHYSGIATNDYSSTHLPIPGSIAEAASFSSVCKWSHYITDGKRQVGMVVFTAKRTGTIKVGPIWIDPALRDSGYATDLLKLLRSSAPTSGIRNLMVSTSTMNWGMQAALSSARFEESHILRNHYSANHDEIIYIAVLPGGRPRVDEQPPKNSEGGVPTKAQFLLRWIDQYFFPRDSALTAWLRASHDRQPNSKQPFSWLQGGGGALFLPKRGGTLSVIPAAREADSWPEVHKVTIDTARAIGARKISMMLPAVHFNQLSLHSAGDVEYALEAQLPRGTYSTRSQIIQLAHFPTRPTIREASIC